MPTIAPLSGAILAGGQSQRLGQDKALLRLWGPQGPTLLEATIALLAAVCDEVLIVTDTPHSWLDLPVRVVLDHYPGGGALGGIYTALLEAEHPFVLTVACDMPFLNRDVLDYMAGLPRDYDVLIPRTYAPEQRRFQFEPLHAIYGRPCLRPIQELLEQGQRRIVRFFPHVRVRYLEEDLSHLDPAGLSFRNINTRRDLEEALRVLSPRE